MAKSSEIPGRAVGSVLVSGKLVTSLPFISDSMFSLGNKMLLQVARSSDILGRGVGGTSGLRITLLEVGKSSGTLAGVLGVISFLGLTSLVDFLSSISKLAFGLLNGSLLCVDDSSETLQRVVGGSLVLRLMSSAEMLSAISGKISLIVKAPLLPLDRGSETLCRAIGDVPVGARCSVFRRIEGGVFVVLAVVLVI